MASMQDSDQGDLHYILLFEQHYFIPLFFKFPRSRLIFNGFGHNFVRFRAETRLGYVLGRSYRLG